LLKKKQRKLAEEKAKNKKLLEKIIKPESFKAFLLPLNLICDPKSVSI
jgi:hypothetical protein